MYTTLFTLAFHRLFWLGEVTVTPHAVFQQNMLFGPNEMHIKMPMSECHRISMPPRRVVIHAQPQLQVCPVQSLKTCLAFRGQ